MNPTNPLFVFPAGLGVAAIVVACGGSNQSAKDASQQQAQAQAQAQMSSGYQTGMQPPPATEPMGGDTWGATNRQPSDTSPSSMPSSDMSSSASSSSRYGSTYGTSSPATDSNSAGSTSPMASGPPSDADLAKLDDAQFAAVIESLNDGEVREAQLVLGQTMNPDVKRFAHDMSVDHQAMMNKAKALWSKLNIMPSATAISGQLDAGTQNDMTTLAAMHGDALDREYADIQARDHMNAADLVGRIIPNVKSAAFRSDLTAALAKIQSHQRMAESLQKQLEKGVTNRQPGTTGR